MNIKTICVITTVFFSISELRFNGPISSCRALPIQSAEVETRTVLQDGQIQTSVQPAVEPNGDVIIDEDEYQELLRRLSDEAKSSTRDNPGNYVADDADLEQILSLIDSGTTEDDSIGTSPSRSTTEIDQTGISRLTTFGDERDECPICLEEMSSRESEQLPICGHQMHKECIQRWIHDVSLSSFFHAPLDKVNHY